MSSHHDSAESDDLDVQNEFLVRFLADREAGRATTLSSYQRDYPGHEPMIAREFAALTRGADAAEGSDEPMVGMQIGPYTVRRELGRGGQAVVYLAHDPRLHRDIALKVLSAAASSLDQQLRLQREAAVAGRLADPGICPVHETGRDGSHIYLAMQFVAGRSLADHIASAAQAGREGAPAWLPLPTVLDWFQRLCCTLQRAHDAGIAHRDLKPWNVMIAADGRPVLLDFGLAADAASDGPLLTHTGDRFGTPAYLAPEHFAGGARSGTATDLWALAVSLFEALTLRRPYAGPTTEALQRAILQQEPPDVRTLRPDLPRDLAAVLRVALDKSPARRYQTAADFGADLAAVAQGLPVQARPPGPLRLAWLWHRRHAVAATALWLLLLGSGAVLERSIVNAQLAESLDGKVREFHLLAGVVHHARARAAAAALPPPQPRHIAKFEAWLQQEAAPLLALQGQIGATIEQLRSRAEAETDAEWQARQRAHPQFPAFERQRQELASLRRTAALADGSLSLVVPALPAEWEHATAAELCRHAAARVSPLPDERTVHGEEALGLACAEAAAARHGAGDDSVSTSEVEELLAWALLQNGRGEAALDRCRQNLATATGAELADFQHSLAALELAHRSLAARLTTATTRHDELLAVVSPVRQFRFADESQQFLHDTLRALQGDLVSFAQHTMPAVERRLRWAQAIGPLSRHHPRARHAWDEVRRALAAADGVVASPLYRGRTIELRDQDVVGLVPIGKNPRTQLWEFYDLRSAWDGESDPAQLPIPEHRADGSIEVTDGLGIVFVLLPGGTTTMGAQRDDPASPCYDPSAVPDNAPVHTLDLAPFFLARHELTQAQWERLWDGEASQRRPSKYQPGIVLQHRTITRTHPVEQVSWTTCARLVAAHALQLPTEAQWEYACRAGTTTAWCCPPGELPRYGNFADASARSQSNWPQFDPWDDQFVAHAPVGSFQANAFGLFDLHGNIAEWCRDAYTPYAVTPAPGDGLREADAERFGRIQRGGAFHQPSRNASSAFRSLAATAQVTGATGLRVARALRPQ